jgi:UDP-N-acetylmuramyl tripeptide synthase
MWAHVLAAAARSTNRLARLRGGSGSVIGGHVATQLSRHPLRHLARDRWVVVVSGTNGKTTTTHLLAAAMATAGPIVTNREGSNLKTGVAVALANDLRPDLAVLEVDEATLARIYDDLAPNVVCLLNLSRDQLDRYGEVRIIAGRWRTTLFESGDTVVVANADDPLVVWAAERAGHVRWVSVGQRWVNDAGVCPACGGRIHRDETDRPAWRCDGCSLARPEPAVVLDGSDLVDLESGERHPIRLALPGRFNLANATMAATAAHVAGVAYAAALAAMADTAAVAGRYRTLEIHGRSVRLLMAKNPAGWQESLDIIQPAPVPVIVAINARVADGHDPSWLWDVPFEKLAGRQVVATGERAYDLAVRLAYAGVEHTVFEGTPLAAAATLERRDVDLVGNYTVFSDILAAHPDVRS